MMKLTLSVPLIWMLFSTAEALKCVQGFHGLNEGIDVVPLPCDSSDDQCVTVGPQDFRNNQLSEEILFRRTCAPSSVCSEANQPFSISFGNIRRTSSLQCCSTDGCNSKDIPFVDEQKPNNLTCVSCDERVEYCNLTQQCAGIEDRCILFKRTDGEGTRLFHACASANLCDGDTDMKMKALLFLDIGDEVQFSAPKCCGTSLCNSAPTA